jgi:ABC-type multidrug transport system ATPase subunit
MDRPAIEVRDVRKTYAWPWRRRITALDGVSFAVERGSSFGLLGPRSAGKTTLLKILASLAKPETGTVMSMARALYIGGDSRWAARQISNLGSGAAELLLLDEPLARIGDAQRRQMLDVIGELHSAGTTILLASRDLTIIESLCDSVAILRQGKLLASGRTTDFRAGRGCRIVVSALPDRLQADLAAGGFSIGLGPRRCWVASPDRSRLNTLIDRLRAANVSIEAVEELMPSLERVYLNAANAERD